MAKAVLEEGLDALPKGARWQGFKDTFGKAFENITDIGMDGEYLSSAVKGAIGWGTVGGVSEWAQGGSFWAGAKSNVISGAMMGAGSKAVNIGANADQWQTAKFGDTFKQYGNMYDDNVSKAVKTIQMNKRNAAAAAASMSK